ncbi:hypothetical protein [Saccharopolyspora gloriosae]|uniref:hypothetical protein n=1 Tax=Saccharopolyspora gloriosae TaxID=455344 RepID=UPI001FB7F06D|nr:hypothetical protein [Saccharopolyspora gloriosae]
MLRASATGLSPAGSVPITLPGRVATAGTPMWLVTGTSGTWDRLWPALYDLS